MSVIQQICDLFSQYPWNEQVSIEQLLPLMDQIDIDDSTLFKTTRHFLLPATITSSKLPLRVYESDLVNTSLTDFLVSVVVKGFLKTIEHNLEKLAIVIEYLNRRNARISESLTQQYMTDLAYTEKIQTDKMEKLKKTIEILSQAKNLVYRATGQKLTNLGFGDMAIRYYYNPKHKHRMNRMYEQMNEDMSNLSQGKTHRMRPYGGSKKRSKKRTRKNTKRSTRSRFRKRSKQVASK